ncbi:MAG: metal-dependent hydrolase [bacterium]|nr:metal-dependent hydrolase [bacterium]
MKLTWIGHAAVKIEGSKTVYVDPFITGNPVAKITMADVNEADVVVLTHDHADHLGDTHDVCKKTGAALVSTFEVCTDAAEKGVAHVEGMNIGGTITVNGVSVSLTPAFHTAGLGGTPTGAIIEMDGKTIYHAGDTGLMMEFQWIGEMYQPDIVFLPIDGRFNMTPRLAVKAVEWLKIPKVIPVHYNTWPMIEQSPEAFKEMVGSLSEVIILNPGESFQL